MRDDENQFIACESLTGFRESDQILLSGSNSSERKRGHKNTRQGHKTEDSALHQLISLR